MLVLTAGMGGGHSGAATEMARRLREAGYEAIVVDVIGLMRFGYGRFITGLYHAQLRFAPWSYQAIYSLWRTHPRLAVAANGPDTGLARRNLLEVVARTNPHAIVSTYNLASQVLGELSAEGSLDVPVYTFVTDFGVHPYWIHDAIDGYLAVHETSQRRISSMSDAPTVVCGPLVAPRFTTNADGAAEANVEPAEPDVRHSTRASLGLAPNDIAALVVAGAWGVGDIEATVADLGGIDGCSPIVLCGGNTRLASRLRRSASNVNQVLGFTDRVPDFMAAADVLVENAGGLTCFEAFASRLPVVTYRPIPAHGIDNAVAMAEAGVNRFAHDRRALSDAIRVLGREGEERSRQVSAAHSVLRSDATSAILDLIAGRFD